MGLINNGAYEAPLLVRTRLRGRCGRSFAAVGADALFVSVRTHASRLHAG